MSKVTPTARYGAVAAGVAGLAALGAVAGSAPAHAADLPLGGALNGAGLPLSTNALQAVKDMVTHDHGQIAGMPLQGIPVVGSLSSLLGSVPSQSLPGLGGLDMGHPQVRSRPVATTPAAAAQTAPTAQTAQTAQTARPAAAMPAPAMPAPAMPPAQMYPYAAAPKAAAGPLGSVGGLTDKLPLAGLGDSLPLGGGGHGAFGGGLLGGLPLAGAASQNGGLLGGLPLESLTGSLGHLAG